MCNFPPYKTILDSIHEGVIVVGTDAKVLYVNQAYTRILGIEREKVFGKKLNHLYPDALVLKALETGKPILNKTHINKGTRKRIVSNVKPLFQDGKMIGAVNIFRDVTELFELQNELTSLNEYNKFLEKKTLQLMKDSLHTREIIGEHPIIKKCVDKAKIVAKYDTTVLITGESGTGKEEFASLIHHYSPRKHKPFVKINCAAIPETLLESELFGYEKGAFTGALNEGKIGKLEQANGGTILLDEIGEMPLSMQAKMLRVLQEKVVERIGSNGPIPVDVRIIAATNQDLKQMIRQNRFREDLFYRINVFPIHIPPLRERGNDIVLLANHFLNHYATLYNKRLILSEEVKQLLLRHPFKGNVRELKNMIEYAVIIAPKQGELSRFHLPTIQSSVEHKNDWKNGIQEDQSLKKILDSVERETIQSVLKRTKTRTEAIRLLGISRKTFYEKLKKYKLHSNG